MLPLHINNNQNSSTIRSYQYDSINDDDNNTNNNNTNNNIKCNYFFHGILIILLVNYACYSIIDIYRYAKNIKCDN